MTEKEKKKLESKKKRAAKKKQQQKNEANVNNNTKDKNKQPDGEIVPPPIMAPQQGINRPQDMEAEEEEVCLEGAKDDEACPLPSMISFIPSNGANNEECSLISSVSDRARRVDRENIK